MHPNEALLHQFYGAFASRDAAAMGEAYADDARFSDPAFPDLAAEEVRAMWRMLIERGKDLELKFSGIQADDERGAARWEATYTFQLTGRKVHNVIDASFRFRDGRIIEHRDRFPFWRWTRQALGLKGTLLGWSPFVRGKVQAMAGKQLAKFMGA